MLTLSWPLGARQARTYHAEEFTNARENYYTSADRIRGQWHGRLARQWGLSADVRAEHVDRLADGRHPITGEPLVRHQTSRTYLNARGETVRTMTHRAGWDATFSAPKSVSLTALVGGDERVRQAHQASVAVALDQLERDVQARLGGVRAETTRNWVAARFEHDSARPVAGYAAPHLHTHVVVFNLTQATDGQIRPLQERELYKAQQYVTAVYRSDLAARVTALGYQIERGSSGQPEIRGYTPEYLAASSPRSQQIQEHLAQAHLSGPGPAQIAKFRTREAKLDASHDEIQRRHRELAQAFGDQPAHVVHAARARAHNIEQLPPGMTAHAAITFAKERNMEREAVVGERVMLRDALRHSMGEVSVGAIKADFEERVEAGEFIARDQNYDVPDRTFTTHEMVALERDTIRVMQEGLQTQPPFASRATRLAIQRDFAHLSEHQQKAVQRILASGDQILALEGVAGGGKTTALTAVREAAEREGYQVSGFAPTARAEQKLGEAGIATSTLQSHLTRRQEPSDGHNRLFVLDESNLASTRPLNEFLHRLGPGDRALLVGDVRQHRAVDAGRLWQQLQEGGIETVRLDEIVRQEDPALGVVVEQLSRGEIRGALRGLDVQGRVHEIRSRSERLTAVARDFARHPEATVVVSPGERSLIEINQIVHRLMQAAGRVDRHEVRMRVLVARQEITCADRQWAERYEPGDVVRYATGSRALAIKSGEYARVDQVHAKDNRLTVTRNNGETVTYDPRRLQGVTLYREAHRAFAVGDRVQFTAPHREQRVAHRELGTIERIDERRRLHLRLDSGRTLRLSHTHPHLDYGYAVTGHSSQGQTAHRVLVHVDTEHAAEQLVNRCLAYVAVSRARYDAQIYTNDKAQLRETIGRHGSHRFAIEPQAPELSRRELKPLLVLSEASELTIAR